MAGASLSPAAPRPIVIPDPALVVLVGPAGCGKSTFARRHFRATEILSSDFFRAMVADDEADQSATADAFGALHLVLAMRLARRRLTVVDATSLRASSRLPLLRLAESHALPAIALVVALPEALCHARNEARADRRVPPHVVSLHHAQLAQALTEIPDEPFTRMLVLRSAEEMDAVVVQRAAG